MMQMSCRAPVAQPIELPSKPSFSNWQFDRTRFESSEARTLLHQNGLDDIDRLFALADRSLHSHKGRAVSRMMLRQADGKLVEAFVKLNWGRRRLIPRMTDLRTGQAFQCLPEREWRGIEALASLGCLVPERLALLKRGWLWFREAVVIKRVRPEFSLDDMIRSGEWNRLAEIDRQAILEAVVGIMRRIHEAGLGWRGTCTRHFFPEPAAAGWQLWLIDCEGVHGHVTQRAIARDYRKLSRAFEISGADSRTLRQFQMLFQAGR